MLRSCQTWKRLRLQVANLTKSRCRGCDLTDKPQILFAPWIRHLFCKTGLSSLPFNKRPLSRCIVHIPLPEYPVYRTRYPDIQYLSLRIRILLLVRTTGLPLLLPLNYRSLSRCIVRAFLFILLRNLYNYDININTPLVN